MKKLYFGTRFVTFVPMYLKQTLNIINNLKLKVMKKALVLGVMAIFAINVATIQNVSAQERTAQPKPTVSSKTVKPTEPEKTAQPQTPAKKKATMVNPGKDHAASLEKKGNEGIQNATTTNAEPEKPIFQQSNDNNGKRTTSSEAKPQPSLKKTPKGTASSEKPSTVKGEKKDKGLEPAPVVKKEVKKEKKDANKEVKKDDTKKPATGLKPKPQTKKAATNKTTGGNPEK